MTGRGSLNEAEARHLDEIRRDCDACLGSEATLLELSCDWSDSGVRISVTYRLDGRERESTATGDTMLEGHRVLRARILFDRIRYGFSDAVER